MAIAVEDLPTTVDGISGINDALNEVAGYLNTQHARLVDLATVLLADENLWCEEGLPTLELYLAWRVGLSAQRARQIVAIARRADELSECLATFRRGELAVDQMAAIANRAPWWTDAEVADLATKLTVGQIRNMLARYPFPVIPDPNAEPDPAEPDPTEPEPDGSDGSDGSADGDPADPADPTSTKQPPSPDPEPPAPFMYWGVGDDGVFRLHVECDPLIGMEVDRALTEARDSLFLGGKTEVTDVDALAEVARRSYDSIDSPERRERFRIYVHLQTDGTATDADGWTLPDAIRQYITCDGLLSPVFLHNNIPISVGRTQRTIPLRTRRVVLLRDQGCRVPGCNRRRHVEIHHIIHWEYDGPTDTWNLIVLCPHHHRMHHRGELGISGNADTPDGVVFTNRQGRTIESTGARPKPPGAPPPPPQSVYDHPLGERLESRWLYFNPPKEYRRSAWANHPHNPHRTN